MRAASRRLLWLRHAVLVAACTLMLVPFYWVIKTAVTNENIYAWPPTILPRDPHLYNFVDVWYLIPFPRYLLNSVIVSALAVAGNVVFNAMVGYALTRRFPGRRAVLALFLSYPAQGQDRHLDSGLAQFAPGHRWGFVPTLGCWAAMAWGTGSAAVAIPPSPMTS